MKRALILSLVVLSAANASGAEKLRDAHPNDAWSWYAIAAADSFVALEASEKMLALAGATPDEEMVALRARILTESGRRDAALKLPMLGRAVALTNAPRVHSEYWKALHLQKGKVAPVIEATLARIILAEAPASLAAQLVLRDRMLRVMEENGDAVAAARAFIAWRHHYESTLLAQAHYVLFRALDRKGNATGEELLTAIRGMLHPRQPSRYALAAVGAREPAQRAVLHDALGRVLLQRGKKAEARKELETAWKLDPKLAKAASGSRRETILANRVDRSLPPFTLKTLDGRVMSNKDLEGKLAVVNFWGLWCAPCVAEMPQFQQFAAKYAKDEKVAIVTINTGDDVDRVRKWMAEKKYTFPVLVDHRWVRKHVNRFPTTWFLDRSGRIAFEAVGGPPDKLVEEFTWRIEALR